MDDLRDIEKKYAEGSNSSPQFEFKEEYWDNALTTLLKAERKDKLRKFLWGGLSIFILFTGAILLYNSFDTFQLNNNVVLKNSSSIPNSNQKEGNLPESIKELEKQTDLSTKKQDVNLNPLSINKNLEGNVGKIKEQNINHDEYSIHNLPNRKVKEKAPINRNENTFKKKNTFDVSQSSSERNNRNEDLITQAKKKNKDINFNNKSDNQNTSLSYSENYATKSENANTSKVELTEIKQKPFNKIEPAINNDRKLELIDYRVYSIDRAYHPIEKLEDGKDFNGTIPVINLEKNNKFSLVLNTGLILNAGFNSKQIHLGVTYLGAEVYYQVSNKLNVSLGAAWYTRGGIGYLFQSNETTYGFGKTETIYYTALDKIYMVEIPFKVSYQLKPNHLVGLGGDYSFIIGGEGRSWSNQLDYGMNGLKQIENQNNQKLGLYTNTYKNPISAFGSYEYHRNRLGLEIRYYAGLNDITIDNVLRKQQIDRNTRILVTFKYLIIK